jgi:two-component system, chemotaxis family, sensor kinase CheA
VNEVVREFLLETHENLAQLDLDLVTLEKEPGERETLARAFRTLHTIKGSAGFLGFTRLQAVAHAAEHLLTRLRSAELTFNPGIASALLAAVDAVRTILAAVEATEAEGPQEFGEVIQALERAAQSAIRPSPIVPLPAPERTTPPPAAPPAPSPVAAEALARTIALPPAGPVVEVPAPASQRSPPEVAKSIVTTEPAETRSPAVSDSSIRVDVGLLDKLMNLVGELVLARNQLVQYSAVRENGTLHGAVQRLNLLTSELQAGVMKTRMQPIGNVWGKFPRLVRDLAVACGKQVRLEMEGHETELDKTIIEAIRDPLTHMVRNAVDHGIEPPAERTRGGKPAEGRVQLRAFHEGGKVIIELADDGGGIDPARVRDKAVAASLISSDQAARMSPRELVNLVFLPGFSTADRVTHFSGRGVGMDVVRTNIEKIGGAVDIESRPGRGTAIKMKIPLTLAIIPALTITAGGDRYCIPQVSLLELVRLDGERAEQKIELVQGAPVYRLRGNLVPIVYLDRQLDVASSQSAGGDANIVVLQADDRPFGLIVDDIHDTEEIVVKPLQKQFKGVTVFSGATILGDGRVALILDVLGLAQRAGVVAGVRERALAEEEVAESKDGEGERQTVLLFSAGGGRMAVPLDLIARLEEFPRSAIERVGRRAVAQYRGEILPLVRVSRMLKQKTGSNRRVRKRGWSNTTTTAPDTVKVVVCASAGRHVGLVVGRIIDIVETTVVTRAPGSRPCVLFTAVVVDRVTEFLDVEGLIRRAGPAAEPAAGRA